MAYKAASQLYAARVIDWSPDQLDSNIRRLTEWYENERVMKSRDVGPFTAASATSWLRLLKMTEHLPFVAHYANTTNPPTGA